MPLSVCIHSQSNIAANPRSVKGGGIQTRPRPNTAANIRMAMSENSIISRAFYQFLSDNLDHRAEFPQCTDRPNDSPFRPSFGSDAVAVVYRDTYRSHVAASETGRIDHGTPAQMSPFSDTVSCSRLLISNLYISDGPGRCYTMSV